MLTSAANSLVAVYAGVRVAASPDYPSNMTVDEVENHHKNLISFDGETSLDIPPHIDNIVNYRATLGHKVGCQWDENTCLIPQVMVVTSSGLSLGYPTLSI